MVEFIRPAQMLSISQGCLISRFILTIGNFKLKNRQHRLLVEKVRHLH